MVRRIFIYGSCASRDAFSICSDEPEVKNFKIVDYFARSSLASSFSSQPVEDRWSDNLVSAFQRQQVKRDFEKSLPTTLENSAYDLLLVDFIDERFSLHRFKDGGGLVTISAELRKLEVLNADMGDLISTKSSERFNLWCQGWDRMVADLSSRGQLSKLLINRVFWANTGMPVHDDIRDDMNLSLHRMYEYCTQSLPERQFLDYSPDLFISDPNHKWGLAPFHYTKPFYREAIRQLMES